MSIESQREIGAPARAIVARMLACLGVNFLNDRPRDPRPESPAARSARPIPIWDLDEY